MRKYILAVLFIAFFSHAAGNLDAALKMWSPISITKNGSSLSIILPQRKITDLIYKAVIKAGICTEIYLGNSSVIKGVKEISVLNEFGVQGYVFQGGINECTKMGKLTNEDSDIYLLGVTRLY